jgi:hypothetical protein
VSDTPDPSVGRHWGAGDGRVTVASPLRVAHRRPGCTTVDVELRNDSRGEDDVRSLDLVRLLPGNADAGLGHVEADRIRLDGAAVRSAVAVIR